MEKTINYKEMEWEWIKDLITCKWEYNKVDNGND